MGGVGGGGGGGWGGVGGVGGKVWGGGDYTAGHKKFILTSFRSVMAYYIAVSAANYGISNTIVLEIPLSQRYISSFRYCSFCISYH